jgi:hypothetical protein
VETTGEGIWPANRAHQRSLAAAVSRGTAHKIPRRHRRGGAGHTADELEGCEPGAPTDEHSQETSAGREHRERAGLSAQSSTARWPWRTPRRTVEQEQAPRQKNKLGRGTPSWKPTRAREGQRQPWGAVSEGDGRRASRVEGEGHGTREPQEREMGAQRAREPDAARASRAGSWDCTDLSGRMTGRARGARRDEPGRSAQPRRNLGRGEEAPGSRERAPAEGAPRRAESCTGRTDGRRNKYHAPRKKSPGQRSQKSEQMGAGMRTAGEGDPQLGDTGDAQRLGERGAARVGKNLETKTVCVVEEINPVLGG